MLPPSPPPFNANDQLHNRCIRALHSPLHVKTMKAFYSSFLGRSREYKINPPPFFFHTGTIRTAPQWRG
jgi:hypothetical protein